MIEIKLLGAGDEHVLDHVADGVFDNVIDASDESTRQLRRNRREV
jgi:hypothetical protein